MTQAIRQQPDALMAIEGGILDSEQNTDTRSWQRRRHEREDSCSIQLSHQPRCTDKGWHGDHRKPDGSDKCQANEHHTERLPGEGLLKLKVAIHCDESIEMAGGAAE